MGAGTETEHYIQDAGEIYFVWKCMEYLQVLETVSSDINVENLHIEFTKYCSERKMLEDFMKSDYRMNVDIHVKTFITGLLAKYPVKKINLRCVEVEYRNEGKKGDFVVEIDGEIKHSVSLKNYKKGYTRIQLCSGTWSSFINNFCLSNAPGVGRFYDLTNESKTTFAGRDKDIRDNNYKLLGLEEIIPLLNKLDNYNILIKDTYVKSDFGKFYSPEVIGSWKKDCKDMSLAAIDIAIQCLDILPIDKVKEIFLKKTDLYNQEDLLLISKDKMLCSIFNENYINMIKDVNSPECQIEYKKSGKSLRFKLYEGVVSTGEILQVDVPFTLQKNGCWYCPKDKYEGTQYHKKEKKELVWGERRPRKSREIATSTNMWFNLKKCKYKLV